MSLLVEQISVLERYEELTKNEQEPQLAIYRHGESDRLFIYSYSAKGSSEGISPYERLSNYVSYVLGRVEFDDKKIDALKDKLWHQAITYSKDFVDKAGVERVNQLEEKIKTLLSEVEGLEAKKAQLTVEVSTLDAQTRAHLETEIAQLKERVKDLRLAVSRPLYIYRYRPRVQF